MIKLKSLLLEKMSPSDAIMVFKKFGVPDPLSLSKLELKDTWRELSKKHHPDTGGNDENMRAINSAYDILKNMGQKKATSNWDWSGDAGSDNPRDINYVKRKAWDISGNPTPSKENEYHIWNWDGQYFRGSFTVFAIPAKLYEISKMMTDWDDHFRSKAVFCSRANEKVLHLVNLDGNEVSPPREFEHDSFNLNPSNDTSFVNMLRKSL